MKTQHQTKTIGPRKLKSGDVIVVKVSHDDSCGNGHNSFAVTANIYGRDRIKGEETILFKSESYWCHSGGCCHDEVREAFPELANLLRWHLCDTEGPMHYVPNALYWAGFDKRWCNGATNDPPNKEHFKSTINYGVLPDDCKVNADCDPLSIGWLNGMDRAEIEAWMESRRERLIALFKADVEAFGFQF
jgi:hypothetical protein